MFIGFNWYRMRDALRCDAVHLERASSLGDVVLCITMDRAFRILDSGPHGDDDAKADTGCDRCIFGELSRDRCTRDASRGGRAF